MISKVQDMIRIIQIGSIYSLRKSSSAKGTATLNDPNDPNRPGELIVNFGGFQRKSVIINSKTISIEYLLNIN